jgi:hypothetical protein
MNCPIQIFQNGQTYRIKVGISGCYGFGVRENEELLTKFFGQAW